MYVAMSSVGQKMLIGFFIVVIGAGVIYTFATRGKLLGVTFFQKHETSTLGSSISPSPIPESESNSARANSAAATSSPSSPMPSATPEPTSSTNSFPTVALTPTPISGKTSSVSSNSFDISSFKYPHSLITAKTDTTMDLESTDDPNTISSWYQNQLTNIGFHATSVVTSNSNGNVLDKLAGANNNSEVKITISKNAGNDPTVRIQVEL